MLLLQNITFIISEIIVKLFLLQLHFLNLIVFQNVVFALKMLNVKYTNAIYGC